MKKLSIAIPDNNFEKNIKKAIGYIDDEIVRIYKEQVKYKNVHLGNLQIYYLYLRSFYSTDYQLNKSTQEVYEIYLQLAEKEWVDNSFYMRGMLALALYRSGKKAITEEIVNSLKQYAQHSDELGMYWDNQRGWFWYNNSIETQTLLIELFHELGLTNDVNEMKVWLLKQKQTQNWKTTKTTAEAVYALLLEGTSILSDTDYPKISIGNEKIDLGKEQTEAGTGYFKKSWSGEKIARNWSQVSIKKSKNTVSWGSVYWQYFEDLDKIKSFEETPLKMRKSLFVKRVKDSKQVIVPLENSTLKVGETVTVRIEIELDRDMEYVHLKDMRASAFEPIDKLSGYRFGASFGYYLSIKDASMNFFIDYLPKGKYVFEYEMFATQKGNFSNGVTTIQSMYAPEFTSHSKGERVVVE